MAHYAKLNENNEILEVISVHDNVITVDGVQQEQLGIDFLISLTNHNNWVQTFQDGSKRKNYATIGGTYNKEKDVFIPLKPYDSWILNEENYQWNPPIPIPEYDGVYYVWDENLKKWQPQIVPPLDNL